MHATNVLANLSTCPLVCEWSAVVVKFFFPRGWPRLGRTSIQIAVCSLSVGTSVYRMKWSNCRPLRSNCLSMLLYWHVWLSSASFIGLSWPIRFDCRTTSLVTDSECVLSGILAVQRLKKRVTASDDGVLCPGQCNTDRQVLGCMCYGPYEPSNTRVSLYCEVASLLEVQQEQGSASSTVCHARNHVGNSFCSAPSIHVCLIKTAFLS